MHPGAHPKMIQFHTKMIFWGSVVKSWGSVVNVWGSVVKPWGSVVTETPETLENKGFSALLKPPTDIMILLYPGRTAPALWAGGCLYIIAPESHFRVQ